MAIQVRARLGANLHLLAHLFNRPTDHAIWRLYSWWGLKTYRVFCECGAEFTKPPPGAQSVASLIEYMKELRALATIKRMNKQRSPT